MSDEPEKKTENKEQTAETDAVPAHDAALAEEVPIEIGSADSRDDDTELEVTDAGAEADPASVAANELEVAKQEAAQTKERMLRVAADFENFKKRAKRDLTESVKQAENKVVLEFLPIVDNLERALSHGEQGGDEQTADEKNESLVGGLRMVHKQFLGTLSRYEIEPVVALGEPFDPEIHEALQQMPSPEFERNRVMLEVQRGYRRGDRLVRPAMVVVSMGPPAPSEEVSVEGDGDATKDGEAG